MIYTKKIVCLANSRKDSERCVAGKEVIDGGYGEWIRPVSNRPKGEISLQEQKFESGVEPKNLDLITISFIGHRPKNHQQENHAIAVRSLWKNEGTVNWNELHNIKDNIPNGLWVNGCSSYNGLNDRILESVANGLGSSLLLFQPSTLELRVQKEFSNRKVRANFCFNDIEYKLVVTDPIIEGEYLKKNDGSYSIDASKIFMCVSVGESWDGFCYKLAASIIINSD